MAKEVLIANAEQIDREELQRIFRVTHYKLTFSEKDEDPLLRVKLFKPDLIIAGTGPGEMNPLDLCETVKGDPESRRIPFIIISSVFSEIAEKDRKRVHADGIISKPFQGEEILRLVDRLIGEGALMEKGRDMMDKDLGWRSIPGMEKKSSKKEGLTLDAFGEGDEEIIDLVDVEEEAEAEPRMRINDFIGLGKEESIGELSPLETWDKGEMEKSIEKDLFVFPEEKDLNREEIPPVLKKETPSQEASLDGELFEKIDMDDILEEVEQLKPSLKEEWPDEEEKASLKDSSIDEKVDELFAGFDDFEAALRKDVKPEVPSEELEPAFFQLPSQEVPEEVVSEEIAVEEELEELSEEEFPASLLEEVGEEEVSAVEEPTTMRSEAKKPEPKTETVEKIEEVETPPKSERLLEKEPAGTFFQGISSPVRMFDKQMEEALAKGMREMMGEVINKFVPEMTHHIIRLTLERIEKMVKDVLPDLAEKAIQEEIKRLQKGEKN